MKGFMISTDYKSRNGAFDHHVLIVDMYKDTKSIFDMVNKEAELFVSQCDKEHPLVVCLHLERWTSYKTLKRISGALSAFKDGTENKYGGTVLVDFTADTAETLAKFGELENFEILFGTSKESI